MYNIEQLQANAKKLRKQLENATKELDFMLAAKLRDEISEIEKLIAEQKA
jgi:excinuclease UvrABC helicase subunit UvrB